MHAVLFVPLLILAAPALTQDCSPADVGKWAEMADAKCSEPLLITDETIKATGDDFWQCQLPAAAPNARS